MIRNLLLAATLWSSAFLTPVYAVPVVHNIHDAVVLNADDAKDAVVADPDQTAKTLKAGSNDVPSLKLPANFELNYDDMFVDVTADCAGPVKFLVVSTADKVKYKVANDGDLTASIGVPPKECYVTVFCVGVVNNKFTDWARCDIHVKGPPGGTTPTPGGTTPTPPNVVPVPAGSSLDFTIIEDVKTRTPAVKNVLESPDVHTAIGGGTLRDLDASDPAAATFTTFLTKKGVALPALVVQIHDGTKKPKPPVYYGPVPASAADMLSLITKLGGK